MYYRMDIPSLTNTPLPPFDEKTLALAIERAEAYSHDEKELQSRSDDPFWKRCNSSQDICEQN